MKLLDCAAAAVVEFAIVADQRGLGCNHDAENRFPVLRKQREFRNNAQFTADLVRQILQQPLGIGEADWQALVIYANPESAAIRIGKCAQLSQIVVFPGRFPLGVLVFHETVF